MIPKEYFNSRTEEENRRLALEAGTTFENWRFIALYRKKDGRISANLANALAKASLGAMTRDEIMFPSEYENPSTDSSIKHKSRA